MKKINKNPSVLETLITSKTRIKLLLKFFLNTNNSSYLRNLGTEFGESSNGIRIELNKLEEAGLLSSVVKGNKKLFTANKKHPLFKDIQNILMKYTGLDHIIDHVLQKLGDITEVYLTGALSRGIESPVVDLLLIGDVNKDYLLKLIERAEQLIHKKIKFVVYSKAEFTNSKDMILKSNYLLLYKK